MYIYNKILHITERGCMLNMGSNTVAEEVDRRKERMYRISLHMAAIIKKMARKPGSVKKSRWEQQMTRLQTSLVTTAQSLELLV